MTARFERAVEIDLSDLAPQGRLSELADREDVVRDSVRGALGVQDLQVEHAVDADLDVVLRDADLFGDVDGHLLQRMLVGDPLDEGDENVESRSPGAMSSLAIARSPSTPSPILSSRGGRIRS